MEARFIISLCNALISSNDKFFDENLQIFSNSGGGGGGHILATINLTSEIMVDNVRLASVKSKAGKKRL